MEIEKDIFDFLMRIEEKTNNCQAELLSIKTKIDNLKEKIEQNSIFTTTTISKYQSDFKFHFGLLWSSIGIVFISLVGLVIGKLV